MTVFAFILQFLLATAASISSQSVNATPAILQGVVTNGANGLPVVGAKVTVNGNFTLTAAMGVYSISIEPAGTFPVSCVKPGFENFSSPPVVFQAGVTTVLNIQLWENLNPPTGVTALLDSAPQHVPVSWGAPSGNYELLYDDGIQDNFTLWSAQGNMNGLKFTPAGYPVQITGGSIHIGSTANYPAGSNPFVPFQVRVYDASGPGGVPGNSIGGPYEIAVSALGWIEFSFPDPVIINSGSFFIVMVQGGNAPNAAGIAIDETTPRFRSYSRWVSGGGNWYPAGGNFMIRARCTGPGGPSAFYDQPVSAENYSIYRLRQGEEQNPTAWTMVGTTPATTITDSNWLSLPCGPYRWGVKAQYAGNRWSQVSFSNILGKCWTTQVDLHLHLSCDSADPAGTPVSLVNLAYPDTTYWAVFDSAGMVSFPNVWKGSYQLTITRFGYDTLTQPVPVVAPVSLDLVLLQIQIPPANLVVNDRSLLARWDVPRFEKKIFTEKWSSGSFNANAWTTEGGSNWGISQALGNPSPSAMFSSAPRQINYSQSLVSRTISGQHSTGLKLRYDVYLDNFGTTTVNQMAVEIWDGASWSTLKSYSNTPGNIPWTSEDLDISGYTDQDFRIRFHATGGDSYDIHNWNVDNIDIIASEPAQEQADCILGYYFYLGNMISGYTVQNAYAIPGNQVQFGETYDACVRALYGSGYSGFACTTFTSHFLYPVRNFDGYPIENAAYLSWEQPLEIPGDSMQPPGLIGYTVYRDDNVIATLDGADILSYYDYHLEPGYYRYSVAARYDLTEYGYPGEFAESVAAGPVTVTISWGHQLPFFESWNEGSFSYNDWRFFPSQGNWIIDHVEGLPSPSANFKWQPPVTDYNYSLESPPFNGLPFNCAAIWLDFDLKLNDRTFTGTEKMIVEVYYNNSWNQKLEIKNTGNLSWTNYHLDISQVRGKGFRVRFRASGQNSSEIFNWYIDNVSIYPVCYPAADLAGQQAGNAVMLSWSPPACYGGNLLSEGFEENFFPPAQWTRQTTNPSATWSHAPAGSPPGVHSGNFAAGLNWDYNHQDEWLIAHDIYVNGDLTFWSYAFQGSLHLDHYYVKISADQGTTWDIMMDMSSLPPYPGTTGVNTWITPYHIDLSMYDGETVDIAWQAVDGDGNGLWYPWAIDDCSIGADDHRRQIYPVKNDGGEDEHSPGSLQEVLGYDVYRHDPGTAGFNKVNTVLVTDTTWYDEEVQTGQYLYFVKAMFNECQNASNSDTIVVDVITGVEKHPGSGISVFPNPATDHILIESLVKLLDIRLYEIPGRMIGDWDPGGSNRIVIGTQIYGRGLYLLRVSTIHETGYFKILLR